MIINVFVTFFFISFLISINYLLKKFNISLDKETVNEKHKSLLRKDS